MPSNPLTHPRTGHDRQFTPRFRPPKATTIADVKPAKTNRSWIPAAGSGSHTALLSHALLADEGTTVLPGPIELSCNYRQVRREPPMRLWCACAVSAHTARLGLEMAEDPCALKDPQGNMALAAERAWTIPTGCADERTIRT